MREHFTKGRIAQYALVFLMMVLIQLGEPSRVNEMMLTILWGLYNVYANLLEDKLNRMGGCAA